MSFDALRTNYTISDCISTELLKFPNFILMGLPDKRNLATRDFFAKVASLPGSKMAYESILRGPLITVTGTIVNSTGCSMFFGGVRIIDKLGEILPFFLGNC